MGVVSLCAVRSAKADAPPQRVIAIVPFEVKSKLGTIPVFLFDTVQKSIFEKYDYRVLPVKDVEEVMRAMKLPIGQIPADKDAIAIGEKLNANIVLVGKSVSTAYRVWAPMLRAKGKAVSDVTAYDVEKHTIVYDKKGVKESSAKNNDAQVVVAVVISVVGSLFMGGHENDEERKAVANSFGAAIAGFVNPSREGTKIK